MGANSFPFNLQRSSNSCSLYSIPATKYRGSLLHSFLSRWADDGICQHSIACCKKRPATQCREFSKGSKADREKMALPCEVSWRSDCSCLSFRRLAIRSPFSRTDRNPYPRRTPPSLFHLVSKVTIIRPNNTGVLSVGWARQTLFLLLLLSLLGGSSTSCGATRGGSSGTATGADVGQELLDVLALKSL